MKKLLIILFGVLIFNTAYADTGQDNKKLENFFKASGSAVWLRLDNNATPTYRMTVPGGWLIRVEGSSSTMVFVPDKDHTWIK